MSATRDVQVSELATAMAGKVVRAIDVVDYRLVVCFADGTGLAVGTEQPSDRTLELLSPSAEEAVAAAFRSSESQEGDFMGKVTADELGQIARLKVDYAHGPGTWDGLPEGERMKMLQQAESWTKCIDAILSRTRRTV